MRGLAWVVVAGMAAGCHGRFKKHVAEIDAARADLRVTAGPHVALGGVSGSGLTSAVINTVQAAKSIDLTRKIGDAVDPGKVGEAFATELDASLGQAPFDVAPDGTSTLQIELLAYGIDVAALGMPGSLTYQLRTRIYLPDGEQVYSANHACAMSFSDPSAVSVVLGTVNNAGAIKDMSNAEIQAMFEGGARYCAQLTATRIRKHGG